MARNPRARPRTRRWCQTNFYWRPMPVRPWSAEQRAAQSAAIKRWKPWQSATGPRSAEGKAMAARNADKGGQRHKLRAEAKAFGEMLDAGRALLDHVHGGSK
jgi:hypothetical protein